MQDAPSLPNAAVSGAPPAPRGAPKALQALRRAVHVWPATADVSANSSRKLALRHGCPGMTSNSNGLFWISSWLSVALSVCLPTYRASSVVLESYQVPGAIRLCQSSVSSIRLSAILALINGL